MINIPWIYPFAKEVVHQCTLTVIDVDEAPCFGKACCDELTGKVLKAAGASGLKKDTFINFTHFSL